MPQKIATCCYCGTRAALVLGEGRHELMCSACGAPLHNLKRLPSEPEVAVVSKTVSKKAAKKARKAVSHQARPKSFGKKKSKARKSGWRWALGEIGDVLEDIFD